MEVLAVFRPDPTTDAELDAIDDPDGAVALYPDAPSGSIGYRWLEQRIAGKAQQTGRYCFVTHSNSISALQSFFPFAKFDLQAIQLDASILKDGDRRGLTRSIARWLYDLPAAARNELGSGADLRWLSVELAGFHFRLADQGDLVDGVQFGSRFGDERRMWAIFERPSDEHLRRSHLLRDEETVPLHAEDAEVEQAFALHGLRWAG